MLTSFILPDGRAAAAHLHLTLTVIHRAERNMTTGVAEIEEVNPEAVKCANRLSDHFFVMACRIDDNGKADVLWPPGANR